MFLTVKEPGSDEGAVDHTVMFLEALKGKVLAFRAVCFVERGQLKEALRDFQLSLQATSGERFLPPLKNTLHSTDVTFRFILL